MFNSLTTLVRTRYYLKYYYRNLSDGKKRYMIRTNCIEVDKDYDPSKDFAADAVHAFAWLLVEEREYSVVAPVLNLEHNFTVAYEYDLNFYHSDVMDEDAALAWVHTSGNSASVMLINDTIWKNKLKRNLREPCLQFIFDRFNEPHIVNRSLEPFLRKSNC